MCHQQLIFVADIDDGDEDDDTVTAVVVDQQNAEAEMQNNRIKEKEVWANGEFTRFCMLFTDGLFKLFEMCSL